MKPVCSFGKRSHICSHSSKASAKASSQTKVMQIQDKVIFELLDKYPDFKKNWLKSVFPYCLKLGRGQEILSKDLTERQLRRFIENATVALLKPSDMLVLEFGGYIFEGDVQSDGITYCKGNFISQNKSIEANSRRNLPWLWALFCGSTKNSVHGRRTAS